MSSRVFLNSLNKFGKRDERNGLQSILSPFCNELINSITIQQHTGYISFFFLSYDIKITLKSHSQN